MLDTARGEADATRTSAREEAERVLAVSRAEAAGLDEQIAQRLEGALGDLDRRRSQLQASIEELRAFEREYRTRLRAYLEGQLRELAGSGAPDDDSAGVPVGAGGAAVGRSAVGAVRLDDRPGLRTVPPASPRPPALWQRLTPAALDDRPLSAAALAQPRALALTAGGSPTVIVLSGALVLVALVLLVFGALDRTCRTSTPRSASASCRCCCCSSASSSDVTSSRVRTRTAVRRRSPTRRTSSTPALVGAQREASPAGAGDLELPVVAPVAAPEPAPPTSRRLAHVEPAEDRGRADGVEGPATSTDEASRTRPRTRLEDAGSRTTSSRTTRTRGRGARDEGSGVTVLVVSGGRATT
jgi:hypothetical protein